MDDWEIALEEVVARTGYSRYRELCQESCPDHLQWRARILAKAAGVTPEAIPTDDVRVHRPARPRVAVAAASSGGIGCGGCGKAALTEAQHKAILEQLKQRGIPLPS